MLQTTVEDLKTRAVEKLSAKPAAQGGARQRKLKQVYLICENRDRELVRPIKQYLFKEQFEVITWLEGEAGAERLMEYHRKNLRECDAALIFFGSGDEPWVRKNLEDLEKAYGYGREDDWTASAVYVGAPPSDQKEDFLTHMVPYVIRNVSSFNPEDLRDFVSAVREAEGGRVVSVAAARPPTPSPDSAPSRRTSTASSSAARVSPTHCIERLERSRFLAVVGTSGSGKSSLVRAGLLPGLLGGMMAGAGAGWRVAVLRPGHDPFGNLACALSEDGVLAEAGGGLRGLSAWPLIEATLRRGSLGSGGRAARRRASKGARSCSSS